jgi:hypothetical protein
MRPPVFLARKVAWGLAWLIILLTTPSLAQGASPDLRIFPDQVEIGSFFRGQRVSVEALIPAGAEAVMEVAGRAEDEHLMRRGRRGGLWLNVGEIQFHQAPSLYLVMATDSILLATGAANEPWGYPALKQRISLGGVVTDQEKGEFFQQFLQLKEGEGLYASGKEPLKKSKAMGDSVPVRGEFRLPANIKPGSYEVCLSVIREGQVIARNCGEVKVVMVSFPAMLSTLAYQHGATYGILAVVIAIIVGFAMGFLFKGGGGD